MKQLTFEEAAKAVNGRLVGSGSFSGVYTDSRKSIKGAVFIALEGERFDGHDFVSKAESDGAAGIIARKPVDCNIPVIYVDDTKKALLALASYYRGLFDVKVMGLTGSVGKTTTKDMTALVLSSEFRTIKTAGNQNNDIGMPMTLFGIDEDCEAAVIEMGMNHFGEISTLTNVSRPDAAIITNIGVSHIENLGSRENILKAKLEILESMKKGSYLILNGDNDLLSLVKNNDYKIIFFGIENKNCDVRAENIEADSDGTTFDIVYNKQSYKTYIPTIGIHNVYDALSAFAAGIVFGINPEKAAKALADYSPSGMRQKTVKKCGMIFIEDCYNASPDSVTASINTLMQLEAKRHIAVLGDMLELGSHSVSAHSQCGAYAAEKNVDILFAYGKESENTAKSAKENGVKEVYTYMDEDEMTDKLFGILHEGDAVAFKASRGMKLENVIEKLYKKLD